MNTSSSPLFRRLFKAFVACTLLAASVCGAARGDLIAWDNFDYPAGTIATEGGAGWVSGSTWGDTAVTGGFSYPDLQTSGNARIEAVQNGGSGNGFREIDTTAGSAAATAGVVDGGGDIGVGTVWISFLGQSPSGDSWFTNSLYRGGSEIEALLHDGGGAATNYRLIGAAQPVQESELAFALFRIDFVAGTGNPDNVSAWINPDLSLGEAGLGAPNATETTEDYTFDRFGIRRNNATTTWQVDEIRVGTTFGDVAPVPEPSAWALAAMGLVACVFFGRRIWTRR